MTASGTTEKKSQRSRTHMLAQIAVISAVAIILGYVETMIPLPVSVPGVKLGLANVAILVALYVLDTKQALAIAIMKVLAINLLFGSMAMFAYSAAGTVLAFLTMYLMKKIPGMGIIPISMASAIMHNVGQIIVACIFMGSASVVASLPVLAVAACLTGAFTGAVTLGVVKVLSKQDLSKL